MSEYPPFWVKTSLGNILQFNYGKSLPGHGRSGEGFPVYGSNGIVGYHNVALTTGETLIIGRKGSVGEVHFSARACVPIDTTYYVDRFYGMPARYWFYQLKNLNLGDLNKATAIPGINREDAYNAEVYLAPLNEQKRIADKLDSLLARVDACRDRLDRIPLILKRFRQSVLSATTSGQLTDENWLQNEDDETTIFCLSQVIKQLKTGPFGSALHRSDYVLNGIPVINPMHINDGSITPTSEMTVSEEKAEQLQEYLLQEGDIILARRGVMGRCAVVGIKEQGWLCGSGSMIIRTTNRILPKYLQIVLSGRDIVKVLEANAVGSTMVNLNQRILLDLEIPVPSIAIQELVTRQVKSLFSYADSLEDRYKKAYLQVEQLTPTLLNMAFHGELVPQDPDDEPAAALLERIQIAKAAQPLKPRVSTVRRSTMTKLSQESVKEIINKLPNDKFSFEELRGEIPGDYDLLKDIFFTLLDGADPIVEQIFDLEKEAMCFVRGSK
jgi:type I restriction enzyme, S subunit